MTCVRNEWPCKYGSLTPRDALPNHVVVGDPHKTGSGACLEGFSVTSDALAVLSHGGLRQDLLVYCLTNDVIIDKTGSGVEDVRLGRLRLPCDADGASSGHLPSRDAWSAADVAPGVKPLKCAAATVAALLDAKPPAAVGRSSWPLLLTAAPAPLPPCRSQVRRGAAQGEAARRTAGDARAGTRARLVERSAMSMSTRPRRLPLSGARLCRREPSRSSHDARRRLPTPLAARGVGV